MSAIRCTTCGWIVTDQYVYELAELANRGLLHLSIVGPSMIAVRCPECGVPISELIDVEKVRDRVRHAHDDNGPGGVCTQCGRLHTATIWPSCERCYGPVNPNGHHHCPAMLLVEVPA